MIPRFLVTIESRLLETYSIEYKEWWMSPAPMINHIAIPTRSDKDKALTLIALGLGKEDIEKYFGETNESY